MSSIDKRINWFEQKKSIQSPQRMDEKEPLKDFFGDILHSSSKIQFYFNKKSDWILEPVS